MHSGRLSAAKKGKQKAGRALVLESAGREPRPPARGDAAANWHAGGGTGVPRPLFLGPPSSSSSDSEDLASKLAAAAHLEGLVKKTQALLGSNLRELEEAKRRLFGAQEVLLLQLQRQVVPIQEEVSDIKDLLLAVQRQDEEKQAVLGSRLREAKRRQDERIKTCRAPELDVAGADVHLLKAQRLVESAQKELSDYRKDILLALGLQDEEMQPVVVPVAQPQRNNNSKRKEQPEELASLSLGASSAFSAGERSEAEHLSRAQKRRARRNKAKNSAGNLRRSLRLKEKEEPACACSGGKV